LGEEEEELVVFVLFLEVDLMRGMNCLPLPLSLPPTTKSEATGEARGRRCTSNDKPNDEEQGVGVGVLVVVWVVSGVVEKRVTSDLARRRKGSDDNSDDKIVDKGRNNTC